jgi:hypothetical protein
MTISPRLPLLSIPHRITHTALPIGQLIRDLTRTNTSIIIKHNTTQPPRPSTTLLLRLPPDPNTLTPLPRLNPTKEQYRLHRDNRPLPTNARVLEDIVVDDGHVKDDEDGDEAEDDGPEEKLVAPHVVEELRVGTLGLGAHAEEGATEVEELPGEEEGEPDLGTISSAQGVRSGMTYHRDECSSSGTEDQFTAFIS